MYNSSCEIVMYPNYIYYNKFVMISFVKLDELLLS